MLNQINSVSLSKEPTSFLGHMSPELMPMLPPIFNDETIDAGEVAASALPSSPFNVAVCHK